MRRSMVLGLLALAVPALAQSPAATPAPRAPRETVSAMVGGHKVAIEYGRPSLRGRKLDALLSQLPADRVWRAGVDQATTFTSETDLTIGETRVPAGRYTLYLHAPTTGSYSLVLNSDPGVPLKTVFPAAPPELADALWPHLQYSEVVGKEVARIPLTSAKAAEAMERFKIAFEPAQAGASALTLTWGEQSWTTGVKLAGPRK